MDGLRAKRLLKIVGKDEKHTSKSMIELVRLLPCHSALKPHLQRLKLRVALYKHADKSILEKLKPDDDGQGWIMTEDGVLEQVWSCGAALPNSLVNLLDTGEREEEERKRRKTRLYEFDFEDSSESYC